MSTDRTASLSHFAFMPVPNFTMIAFTNAIEVLRMANYLTGQTLYRWSIVSPDGGPVTASNGLSVDTGPVECVGQPDIVFVVGGIDVQRATTPAHLSALRRFARLGCVLGSLCTGTYALAAAMAGGEVRLTRTRSDFIEARRRHLEQPGIIAAH